MRYSQESKKIQKLFNEVKRNTSTLDNQKNDNLILDFFNTTIKTDLVFMETDWLFKETTGNFGGAITKDTLLPKGIDIDFNTKFELPDTLLPYIDFKTIVKTQPDSQLANYKTVTGKRFIGQYLDVKGDSTQIYKAHVPTSGLPAFTFLSESSITDMGVSLTHTKKAWLASFDVDSTINYGAGVYRRSVFSIYHRVLVGDILTEFLCDYDDTIDLDSVNTDQHEITSFSATTFTAIGQETVTDLSTIDPPVITNNVTRTLSFASADSFQIHVRGLTGAITETSLNSISDIVEGKYLYYSNLKQRSVRIDYNIGTDDYELNNLPTSIPGFSGDFNTLPYTKITLDRNPDGFPTQITETSAIIGLGEKKDFTVFKINEENNNRFAQYYFKYKTRVSLLFPATEINEDVTVLPTKTQVDEYTGASYSRTSNVTGIKPSSTYGVPSKDIQYKILVILRNPFSYQEVRKYDTSQ